MNKIITQDNQNNNKISKSIKRFFTRFHVSSALKASNVYKKKGTPVIEIFQYMFLLIFSNRSMYMNLITGRNTPAFAKDTVYRFAKMIQINWIGFTTILASRGKSYVRLIATKNLQLNLQLLELKPGELS